MERGIPTKRRYYLIAAGAVLLGALAYWVVLPRLFPPKHRPVLAEARLTGTTNILLVGTDKPRPGRKSEEVRSDVLILASCDTGRNRVTMLSIPRDTLVEIPGHGQDRINAAYEYGGIALTRLMVEKLTGLPVHRYAAVDFRAFEELVDLLRGVEVEVDKRMYYSDKSQGLLIDLRKGRQTLNGRQALGFVRYRRDPMGDLARVGRQQRLLRAVMEKANKEHLWTKFIPLFSLARRYVRTDLSLIDLYRLRNFLSDLANQANVSSFTVPGWFSGPCWAADQKALAALIEREFKPIPKAPQKGPKPVSAATGKEAAK